MGDGALDDLLVAVQEDLRSKGYSETAIKHATVPVNMGDISEHDAFGISFHTTGDTIAIWIKVTDGIITNAFFNADKNDALTACGSLLTQLLSNKTLARAGKLTAEDVILALDGLPQEEQYAAGVAIQALQAAINDFSNRKNSA